MSPKNFAAGHTKMSSSVAEQTNSDPKTHHRATRVAGFDTRNYLINKSVINKALRKKC